MKKFKVFLTLVILSFLTTISWSQNNVIIQTEQSQDNNVTYNVNYIAKLDYIDDMFEVELEDSKMSIYYKNSNGELFPAFFTVEEAKANARNSNDSEIFINESGEIEIYVLHEHYNKEEIRALAKKHN